MPSIARQVDSSKSQLCTDKSHSDMVLTANDDSASRLKERMERTLANRFERSYSYEPEAEYDEYLEDVDTPFEKHLQKLYGTVADIEEEDEGVAFFQSHGYYDVDDCLNTLELWKNNLGLDNIFDSRKDEIDFTESDLYPFARPLEPTVFKRERTRSGRFELLDEEGNVVDEGTKEEIQKEGRLKSRSLALDDQDVQELLHDQEVMAQAVSVIQTEQNRFKEFFLQALMDEDKPSAPQATVMNLPETELTLPQTPKPVHIDLPPYCGHLYVLKDTIPLLLRSWRKRWFYLDFNAGLVFLYKRSYWKSARGVIDLRSVTRVEAMNHGDLRLEFKNDPLLIVRSKDTDEADLWVQLLKLARQQAMQSKAPRTTQVQPDGSKGFLVEAHKFGKKKHKKNQAELMNTLLLQSAKTNMSNRLLANAVNSPEE